MMAYVSGNDVYVAGYEYKYGYKSNGDYDYTSVAVVWKNGIAQHLTDGTHDAYANSVFVSGSDVYVAGQEDNLAVVWKNGKVQKLTDGTRYSCANSVFVFDNDVYVTGEKDYDVVVWKNGKMQKLTERLVIDDTIHTSVKSAFVVE